MKCLFETPLKNFQLIKDRIDTAPALAEINALNAWDWLNLRKMFPGSAHRESSDIVMRFAPLNCAIDFSSIMNGLECMDYWPMWSLNQTMNLIAEAKYIINPENNRSLGRIIITRLDPGKIVYPHMDEGKYAENHDRFHIVLSAEDNECIFQSGIEGIVMKTGQCWKFNHQELHNVINQGKNPRINLIFDLKRI